MSAPLRIEHDSDGIATLWLDPNPARPRGGVVVLDSWLIGAISESCAHVAAHGCSGLVLASSSPRVFVAGADLAEIDGLNDEDLDVYLQRGAEAFASIPALGVPTAAAVHRAALGGGLELAMHCDALIGGLPGEGEKPWMVGLPECGLCICPGWGGTQMLPARIDPEAAITATINGTPWKCTDAPEGLFESVMPAGSPQTALVDEAKRWVREATRRAGGAGGPGVSGPGASGPFAAARAPRRTIGPADRARVEAALTSVRATAARTDHAEACFDCIRRGITSGWADAVAAERAHLVRLRHTPAAREKLQAFLSK